MIYISSMYACTYTGRQRSACHSCLCVLSSAACADGLSFVARHGSDGQETAAGATATATTHVRHLTRSGGAVFSLGRNVIASKVCVNLNALRVRLIAPRDPREVQLLCCGWLCKFAASLAAFSVFGCLHVDLSGSRGRPPSGEGCIPLRALLGAGNAHVHRHACRQ